MTEDDISADRASSERAQFAIRIAKLNPTNNNADNYKVVNEAAIIQLVHETHSLQQL